MRNKRLWPWVGLLAALPLLCAVAFAYFQPRSLGIAATDQEHDYLYHAHLLNEGQPLWSADHPGIPAYYLGAGLMALNGTDLAHTDRFLRTARLTTALLASLAVVLALWLIRSTRASAGATLLFGALSLAWPSTLTFLDYFGADALVFPVSLILTAATWRYLYHPSRRMLVVLGMIAGFGLAVKLSLVPLVMSVMVALAIRSRFARLVGFTGLMAATFIVSTLPSAARMIHSFARAFQREVVSQAGRVLPSAIETWISASAPAFIVVVGAFGTVSWLLVRQRRAGGSSQHRAMLAFTGVGLLFFVYFLLRTRALSPDAGIALRNMAAIALVLPVSVLLVDQLMPRSTRRSLTLGLLAVLVVSYPIIHYAYTRHAFITETQERAARIQAGIESHRQSGVRLAFWDGSPGTAFGTASFHFWGNYRYAHEEFDARLLHHFPRFSFFRLRHLKPLIDQERGVERARRLPRAWMGPVGKLYLWLLTSPGPYSPLPVGPLYTGDTTDVDLRVMLAAPLAEFASELHPYTVDEGIEAIHNHLGPMTVQEIQLDEEPWLIFTPTDSTARKPDGFGGLQPEPVGSLRSPS